MPGYNRSLTVAAPTERRASGRQLSLLLAALA
jgi:hypothetical protein